MLSPDARAALTLTVVGGLTTDEIARFPGPQVSPAAPRRNVARLMQTPDFCGCEANSLDTYAVVD
jgi:predicted RNA polymerase sigma factor